MLLYENRRALPLVIAICVFFGLLEWRVRAHLVGGEYWVWLVAVCVYVAKYIGIAFLWLDHCLNAGRNKNLAPSWAKLPGFLLTQGKFWSLTIVAYTLFLLPAMVLVVVAQRYTNIAWWVLTLVPVMSVFTALVIQFRFCFLVLDFLSGQKSGLRSVWLRSKCFGRDMALALVVATVILSAPVLLLRYVWDLYSDEMLITILSAVSDDVVMLVFLSIMLVAYKEVAKRQLKDVSIPTESA